MGTYRCRGAATLLGLCLWAGGAARLNGPRSTPKCSTPVRQNSAHQWDADTGSERAEARFAGRSRPNFHDELVCELDAKAVCWAARQGTEAN